MSIKLKRDLSGIKFFCKSFKASKFISGKDYKTALIVLICCGVRVDLKF